MFLDEQDETSSDIIQVKKNSQIIKEVKTYL